MRKSVQKIISFICSLSLVIGFSYNFTIVNADSSTESKYEYPTLEELNELETMDEKYEACNIDSFVLKTLNDDELIQAIYEYPFLLDIYAYDNFDAGLNYLKDRFNGIDELVSRNITIDSMSTRGLQSMRQRIINQLLTDNTIANSQSMYSSAFSGYVQTPNGTNVGYYSYDEAITAADIQEFEDYLSKYYSTATLLRNPTTKYNCHSYAWYSTSASNTKWIPYADSYMNDGSYEERSKWGNIFTGDKVYYSKSGYEHSGIVYNNSSLNYKNVWVTSKWGAMGLVRHLINNCPYYVGDNYSYVSFWY